MSKGDWQRPVNKKKFNNNYDKIFKQKQEKKKPWTVGMYKQRLPVWVDLSRHPIQYHIQNINK